LLLSTAVTSEQGICKEVTGIIDKRPVLQTMRMWLPHDEDMVRVVSAFVWD
jgi:hypothetical protein